MSATIRWRTTSAPVRCTKARSGIAAEHRLEADQARPAAGHVDLGHVAGDDGLGAEADAGQEHLHLLGAGVLGLVEDDEAVVERAAAHEGERGHLDGAPVDQALGPLGLEQVVEGVVERPEVGVDLGHHVAGQEPSRSPASTAGRVRMIRLTWWACRAWTARATARYDLPVPAGPMPKVTMLGAMASA